MAGSFGYLGKRTRSIAAKKTVAKQKATRVKPKTPKIEGTTITYGQAFHYPFVEKDGCSPAVSVVGKKLFSDKQFNKSDTQGTRSPPSRMPVITSMAPISKDPPPVMTLMQAADAVVVSRRSVAAAKKVITDGPELFLDKRGREHGPASI